MGPPHAEPRGARDGNGTIRALLAEGRRAEAEAEAQRRLAEVEAAGGARSLEAADLLDLVVSARIETVSGPDPELLALATRTLEIREHLVGQDHRDLIEPLERLAAILARWDDGAESARRNLERAIVLGQRFLGGNHPRVLADRLSYGRLLVFRIGTRAALDEARPLLEATLAACERLHGPAHPLVAKCAHALASAQWRLGDLDRALAGYRRCLALEEKRAGPDSRELIYALNSLGNTHAMLGEYVDALRYHERARAIEARADPREPGWETMTHIALGGIQLQLGNFADARASFEAARLASTEASAAWIGLGDVHRAVGELDLARECYERYFTQAGPGGAALQASVGLARVEHAAGNLDRAREFYERSLSALDESHRDLHHASRELFLGLTRLDLESGDLAAARQVLDRAFEFHRTTFGESSLRVAETLTDYARLHRLTGAADAAFEAALRAEEITRDQRRLATRGLAEREALHLGAVRTSSLDLLLVLAVEAGNKRPGVSAGAWDAVIRSRALVLDEMAARRRAASETLEAPVADLAARLAAARTRLAQLAVRGPGDSEPATHRGVLDEARREKERLERELAGASSRLARRMAHEQIGLADVARRVGDGAALVAYVSYRDESGAGLSYAAFVLRGGGGEAAPVTIALGPAKPIDAEIDAWRRLASRSAPGREDDLERAALALRARIWDPLAPSLDGADRILVVPDGALHLVSLAALPAPGGGYLVERGPLLHYLSAERDIVGLDDREEVGTGLLAVGGPDYDGAPRTQGLGGGAAFRGTRSKCGDFDRLRFEPLPGATTEVEEVAARWAAVAGSRVDRFVGSAAAEAEFKRFAPGRRVLHLATHGFFLQGRCEGPDDENPLVLSGLALAAANRRREAPPNGDDGILTAEEIASLDLSGVEWAVLSACDTGLGELVAGEGVLGLRRAFQIAGARSLILSLWPVQDDATTEWMIALYAHRLRGLGTAQAVREASRTVIDRRRADGSSTHPSYWAGYLAAGDWR